MSERMHVTTHFLQMHAAPELPARQLPDGVRVTHERSLTPQAYRDLYNGVGASWLWYERSDISDRELEVCIRAPDVSIFALYDQDELAGYTEMRRHPSSEIQILYFGLLPDSIGKGLGGCFLDWTVREAFSQGIERLWVHTCSLDHPRALDSYKRVGFVPYRRESGWVTIPQSAIARQQLHSRNAASTRS